MAERWTHDTFVSEVNRLLEREYHHRHPFHVAMNDGQLGRRQLADWARNRYFYQAAMPVKDAIILSKLPTREARRVWVARILDQDGRDGDDGGLEEWLRMAAALGVSRDEATSTARVAPGVRFAVDSYVRFCDERPWPEAVAASLTQLAVPDVMRRRTEAFQRHYGLATDDLHYFTRHADVAGAETEHALELLDGVLRTRHDQERALDAVRFKCQVLWALLDAVAAIR